MLALASGLLLAFVACSPRGAVDAHVHHHAAHGAVGGILGPQAKGDTNSGGHSMAMAFQLSTSVTLWTSSLSSSSAGTFLALLLALFILGLCHESLAAYRSTLAPQQQVNSHSHLHAEKKELDDELPR